MARAFWQVPLREGDGPKTAFATERGLFEWTRMPFGLCNATSTFQRLMNSVLGGIETKPGCVILVYVDDVLIATQNVDDHISLLGEVFKCLIKAGLKCKAQKCSLFQKEVKFLRRTLDADGMRIDELNANTIKNWATPQTKKHIQSFLGLANYFREFINGFASIAAPMNDLIKKDVQWNWSQECQNAFDTLKMKLTSAPVLKLPNAEGRYFLDTDASDVAIGAVLMQEQLCENGLTKKVVVQYGSKALGKSQRNYSVPKKEMYAVITFCEKFRSFLEPREFTLRVDNAALSWLKSYSLQKCPRAATWALALTKTI